MGQNKGRRVWIPVKITHSRMISYIESKCGMNNSVGVTRLAYTESGNLYIVWNDEQLQQFLESVAGLEPPATLYAYDDISVCSEDNVPAGDDIQNCYQPQFEYENQQAYGNAENSNYTHGVFGYNTSTSYVFETQQPPEEEEDEDEEVITPKLYMFWSL